MLTFLSLLLSRARILESFARSSAFKALMRSCQLWAAVPGAGSATMHAGSTAGATTAWREPSASSPRSLKKTPCCPNRSTERFHDLKGKLPPYPPACPLARRPTSSRPAPRLISRQPARPPACVHASALPTRPPPLAHASASARPPLARAPVRPPRRNI